MIFAIPPSERTMLRPLFASVTYERVVCDAILDGTLPFGEAWADHRQQPRVALLHSHSWGFVIVGGDASAPEAPTLLRQVVAQRGWGAIWVPPGAWEDLVATTVGEQFGARCYHVSFHGQQLALDWLDQLRHSLPDGFSIRPLDRDALATRWPHVPQPLLAQRFGYGAYAGTVQVCFVAAYWTARGKVHITLETEPAYRRKGIATAVAAQFCIEALQRQLDPYWTANVTNHASYRLALKLGLRPEPGVHVTFGENG
jgi:GNAT superfamily N-acetyltransferase